MAKKRNKQDVDNDHKYRDEFFRRLPPNGIVIELGVWVGKNALRILEQNKPKFLYLVDLYASQPDKHNIYRFRGKRQWADAKKACLERLSQYDNFKLICEDFNIIVNTFEDEFFDIVYIDGNHDYKNVMNDLEKWYPKVKSGGYLCGHDYNNVCEPQFEVTKSVDDFLKKYNLDIEFKSLAHAQDYAIRKKC